MAELRRYWVHPKGGVTENQLVGMGEPLYFATNVDAVLAEKDAELARVKEQVDKLKRGIKGSDFELAFLDAYLDNFNTLRTELATLRELARLVNALHDEQGDFQANLAMLLRWKEKG